MANNTVVPTSVEDKNKKLASNPATRQMMNQKQAEQAAKEGRSAELPSVKPIPQKKSGWQKVKDYVADAGHELFDTDTPEMKETRQKQLDAEYEVNKQRVDKKKKDLITTAATLGPIAAGGAGLAGGAGVKGLAKVLGAGATGVAVGGVADALMDGGEKKKAKAETVPANPETNTTNNGDTSNAGAPSTNKNINNKTKTENTEDKTYDNYIAKVAKQQGLGKYVKEDGTVDYDKLQKSKVGYQILNALIAGIGGAAAGAAFKDAPDMSKSMLAQEVDKRNRVVDEAQKTAEQEKLNDLDLSTFTAKLGLQGQQALNAQKEMARFMSNLSYNDQVRMMNYMQGMSVQDAMKLGFAQNPYGAMGAAFNGLGGLAQSFSDECCKKFASRKVFK